MHEDILRFAFWFLFSFGSCSLFIVLRRIYLCKKIEKLIVKKVQAILNAIDDGVSMELIDKYLEIIDNRGIDSLSTQAMRKGNIKNIGFIKFCDEVDKIERRLHGY